MRPDGQLRPVVDGVDPDLGLRDDPGVDLDRRLAVEVDGRVDDAAAVLEGVGRRVRPSAAEVEPRGRAAPDDLVGAEGVFRACPAAGRGS